MFWESKKARKIRILDRALWRAETELMGALTSLNHWEIVSPQHEGHLKRAQVRVRKADKLRIGLAYRMLRIEKGED
ncbi:unnamed protein product [marine sediment metagenome]|uniref:Uncharacterized protein n=1 Tax=marine sediment metagenome TaxID=412755 RepID=X0TEF0_9ZZZZ